jgi:hypothetical protein
VQIQDIQNRTVQVDTSQATFLKLKIEEQIVKFDFIDKREFYLKNGTTGLLQYFEEHPLLFDYNEIIVTTYLNSKLDDFDSFVADIKVAIDEKTLGWRNWKNYVEDKCINLTVEKFYDNLRSGSGKLLEAPLTITENVIKVCDRHKILTKSFRSEPKKTNYKLITIDNNYVIAKEFKVHTFE